MAEECTDSSIATSNSTTPSSWWEYNSTSLSSWNTSPWHTQNPSSNSSCEEDVSISTSFTNVSNRSGLTGESSPQLIDNQHAPSYEFVGEHTPDNNLWTNVLIQDVKENYLDVLSSRSSLSSAAAGMLEEPAGACDYLKKMDTASTWELANSATALSNFNKQFNMGFSDNNFINDEGERLANKLSTFVSSNSPIEPQPNLISLSSSLVDHNYLHTDLSHMKQMFNDLTLCPIRTNRISGLNGSCYDHDMNVNVNNQHRDESEPPPGALLRRSFNSTNIGNGYDLFGGLNSKYYRGLSDSSCRNGRNFDDNVMFFRSKLNNPSLDFHAPKPSLKSLNLPDCKKQRSHGTSSSSAKSTGRGQGNSNEGKKKRSEDNSETTVTKKPKHESSTASSVKMQAPKLGERITALQQIVSPFGKTDTASVLLEAIGYIKFLQEQVQLLSNPYMKANTTKLQDPWGNLDRKDRGDLKLDLKSRGLCLVPLSCTPQVYRENTGSDYWTPTYRGCLYR